MGNPRDEVALRPPREGTDYSQFPVRTVGAGLRWFRAYRDAPGRKAWFFSSIGWGRFDVASPNGTCYVANTPEVAVREVIGPDLAASGMVNAEFLQDRTISEVTLPYDVQAAKLTSKQCLSFGVTAELGIAARYALSQAWAEVLLEAGFGGLWYQPRFSGAKGRALAIFDDEGEKNYSSQRWSSMREVVDSMAGLMVIDPYSGWDIHR